MLMVFTYNLVPITALIANPSAYGLGLAIHHVITSMLPRSTKTSSGRKHTLQDLAIHPLREIRNPCKTLCYSR